MKYFKALLWIGIAFLTFAYAGAETVTHPIGMQVTFPDAWDMEIEEDDIFLSESDESAVVWIAVTDADNVDLAAEDVDEELAAWLANIKTTRSGEEGTINGLPATFIEGTGTLDGVEANWLVTFIRFGEDIVMVASWGEAGEWDPEKGDVVDIIRSVRPTGP